MVRNARDLVIEAERRFPIRVRVVVPPGGFGSRLNRIYAWLDENCGADGWQITPSGIRGVVNDAIAVYFGNAVLAAAFVARWCAPGPKDGFLRAREDEPLKRVPTPLHRTPGD
jgi:hypothetical protein